MFKVGLVSFFDIKLFRRKIFYFDARLISLLAKKRSKPYTICIFLPLTRHKRLDLIYLPVTVGLLLLHLRMGAVETIMKYFHLETQSIICHIVALRLTLWLVIA